VFDKVDVKRKGGKGGKGGMKVACIPCRYSKAECSHAKLIKPLEETGWGAADLEAYWNHAITLTELLARRQPPSGRVGPCDIDQISRDIKPDEEAAFDKVIKQESDHVAISQSAARTTLTVFQRQTFEERKGRREARAKAIVGSATHELPKLKEIQYIARRLREGTLTHPLFPWKKLKDTVQGQSSKVAPVQQYRVPYADFHASMGRGDGTRHPSSAASVARPSTTSSGRARNTRSLARSRRHSSSVALEASDSSSRSPSASPSIPGLSTSRSPTCPPTAIVTPELEHTPLPTQESVRPSKTVPAPERRSSRSKSRLSH
jgi:hypothetical protein